MVPGSEGPEFAAVHDRIVDHVTGFVRDLRRAGVAVPANAGIDATRALAVVGFDDFWRARAATRATMLTRQEDAETFDRLFPRFWEELLETIEAAADGQRTSGPGDAHAGSEDGGPRNEAPDTEERESARTGETPRDQDGRPDERTDDRQELRERADVGAVRSDDGLERADGREHLSMAEDADDGRDEEVATSVYSRYGRPEPVGLVGLGEQAGLHDAVQDLTRSLAELDGPRWTRAPTGGRIDARGALRRSFATGGTVLDVPHRTHRTSEVRGVVLVDVSRSVLDTVDRGFLIRFLRALSAAWRDIRIYFFDTSIREVSDQFGAPSAAAALAAIQRAETTWGGGTRIGHALSTLRGDDPHAVDRRTTVFVVSDGLEVGDVDLLEAEMARLSRLAKRVIWLNPLAAAPNYEPSCRGMAVSLPYVDGLFAFAGPDDVAEMARQLRLHGPDEWVGYESEPRQPPG